MKINQNATTKELTVTVNREQFDLIRTSMTAPGNPEGNAMLKEIHRCTKIMDEFCGECRAVRIALDDAS